MLETLAHSGMPVAAYDSGESCRLGAGGESRTGERSAAVLVGWLCAVLLFRAFCAAGHNVK